MTHRGEWYELRSGRRLDSSDIALDAARSEVVHGRKGYRATCSITVAEPLSRDWDTVDCQLCLVHLAVEEVHES